MKFCNQCGTYHSDKSEACSVCRNELLIPSAKDTEARGAFARLFLGLLLLILSAGLGFGTAFLLDLFEVSVYLQDLIPLSLAWLGLFELLFFVRRKRREHAEIAEFLAKNAPKPEESPIVSALKKSAAALGSPFSPIAKDESYEAPRPRYDDDSYAPVPAKGSERPAALGSSLLDPVTPKEEQPAAPAEASPFASPFSSPFASPFSSPFAESVAPAAAEEATVSAETDLLAALTAAVPEATYDDTLTIPDAFEILYSQLSNISRRTVRTLLAAAATSRLILFSENPKVDAVAFDEAREALTGRADTPLAPSVTEDGELAPELSAFVAGSEAAKSRGFSFAKLAAEATATLGNGLSPLLARISRRDADDLATFCLVSTLPAEVGAEALPDSRTLSAAAIVTVLPKKRSSKTIEFADYTGRHLSFARLAELAAEAEESNYLPEELWKKLDLLEEHLAPISDFAITNSRALMIERYTAVFMAAGGSDSEALDSVLACRLLPPVLAALLEDADIHRNETFTHYLDSLLGLDNLPMTAELLRKFGIA